MITKLTSFTFSLAVISTVCTALTMFANLLIASQLAYLFWHLTLASMLAVLLMLGAIAILSLVMEIVHRHATLEV